MAIKMGEGAILCNLKKFTMRCTLIDLTLHFRWFDKSLNPQAGLYELLVGPRFGFIGKRARQDAISSRGGNRQCRNGRLQVTQYRG